MNCCFCKKEIMGYGHNPWPAVKEVGSRCCADCNLSVVIPERLRMFGHTSESSPTTLPKPKKTLTIQLSEDEAKEVFDFIITQLENVDNAPAIEKLLTQLKAQLEKEV